MQILQFIHFNETTQRIKATIPVQSEIHLDNGGVL